jgi:hypothetical protein
MKVPIRPQGIDHVTIGAAVDLFPIEGLHEALHLGVVVRVADPAPGAAPKPASGGNIPLGLPQPTDTFPRSRIRLATASRSSLG